MSEVFVVGTLSCEEAYALERKELATESLGGMGGCVDGEQWPEFIATYNEKCLPYLEAFRNWILEARIRCGGDWHQNEGTPVFSDGTYASFSYRAWGDHLAALWNWAEQTDKYSYMSFYMCSWEQSCVHGQESAERRKQLSDWLTDNIKAGNITIIGKDGSEKGGAE